MNRPINHHYIPKCYLTNFCNEGWVYRLKLDYLHIKQVSPTAICYEPHFYAIDQELKSKFVDLSEHSELKAESEILARSESNYPAWFKTIADAREMSLKDCINFSQFILTLKTRTKFWRKDILRKTVDDNVDRIGQELLTESLRHPVFKKYPIELLQDAVERSIQVYKDDPDAIRYLQLHRILELRKHERHAALDAVIGSKWTLVINKTALPFVTTDNPGVSFNILTGETHSVGFSANFVFMLPLSPTYLLRIDCSKKDAGMSKKHISTESVSIDIVHAINIFMISISDSLVISSNHLSMEKYKQIIARYRLING